MDPKVSTPIPTPAAPVVAAATSSQLTGWSWGAFMLGPTYIIAVKKYMYLLLYLLFFVPIVGVIAFLIIAIVLGKKGRQLAYESSIFANESEATGFIKAADFAGKVMFVISVIGFVVVIVFWIIMAGFFFQNIKHTTQVPQVQNTQYK